MTDGDEYEIVCSKCGRDATVPFEPTEEGAAVYCRECYERDKRKRRERETNAPRKKHGTRVSIHVECAECGEETELDYMPRGKSLDEVMCPDCYEKEGADERWKEIREHKELEQNDEWTFECDECGRVDAINHKPKPNKSYLCTRCFYDHAEPSPDRVENKEAVGDGVYIRKDES